MVEAYLTLASKLTFTISQHYVEIFFHTKYKTSSKLFEEILFFRFYKLYDIENKLEAM